MAIFAKADIPQDVEEVEENPDIEEEEVKNTEIKPEVKRTVPVSTGSKTLDIEAISELIQEVNFASLKLAETNTDLKKFNELGDILEHVKSIKDIKIDTSSFEDSITKSLIKLENKVSSVTKNADFHELDEIDSKLKKINSKVRTHRFVDMFLIAGLAFGSGYLFKYIYSPTDTKNLLSLKEQRVIFNFKKKGKILIKNNGSQQYIVLANSLKIIKGEGQTTFILNKQ